MLMLVVLPLALLSQQSKWNIETSGGGNFSFNKYEHVGNVRNLKLPVTPGVYFDFRALYSLKKNIKLVFGGSADLYKYQYNYFYELKIKTPLINVGDENSTSVMIWGFDLGIENNWINRNKFIFSSGYGFKYKIDYTGQPFLLTSSEEIQDTNGNTIFRGIRSEYDIKFNNAHLLIIFAYLKAEYKINKNFSMFFKVTYNQGILIHETLYFKAKHEYPQQNEIDYENYKLFSRTTNLSYGIGFNYTFNKLKKNRTDE